MPKPNRRQRRRTRVPPLPESGPAARDADSGWSGYYEATAGQPPRRTTLTALAAIGSPVRELPATAIDLGCGGGRDTASLLEAGLTVLALDGDAAAGKALRTRFPDAWGSGRLTFRRVDFSRGELDLPASGIVNASFCLPACPPDRFGRLWSQIADAVAPGGLFAGHLFGPNDSWARRGDNLTIHNRRDIDVLLAGWEPLLVEEEESDAVTPRGSAKHWHFFHVVARKAA